MDTLQPKDILKAYVAAKGNNKTSENLWNKLKEPTKEVLARGCRHLAAIWEAAWEAAKTESTNVHTGVIKKKTLSDLYEDTDFLKSYTIDKIGKILKA